MEDKEARACTEREAGPCREGLSDKLFATRDNEPDDQDAPQFCIRLSEDVFEVALCASFAKYGGYNPRSPHQVYLRKWIFSQVRCSMKNDDELLVTEEVAEMLGLEVEKRASSRT